MKTFYLYVFIAVLYSISISAQITFSTTKVVTQNSETGYSVVQLPDSNFIVQGSYFDFEVNPAGTIQSVFLMKINQYGEMLWLKKYANPHAIYYPGSKSLIKTQDGGLAFAATYQDDTGDIDYILWKFDSKGDSLWTKRYGGEEFDICLQGRETSDGGFVLIGRSYSFTDNPEEDADIYLVRTNKDGNLLWANTYGDSGEDFASTVEVMPDGGFLIGASLEKSINGEPADDGYLIKTSNSGEIEWSKRYGEAEAHCIIGVNNISNNNFIMSSCKLINHQDEWILPSYLAKLNSYGDIDWTHETPIQSDYFVITNVEELVDGSFIFCGWHLFAGDGNGHWGLIGKLTHNGELLWQKEYYTNEWRVNLLYDIVPTFDGGFLASGTAHNPADTISNEEGRNIWLLKVNCQGDLEHSNVCTDIDVGIEEELLLKQNSLHIFPNPTQDQVQFAWNTPATQLSVYTITGQLIEQVPLGLGQKALQLEVVDWQVGVYLVLLEGEKGAILGREKLVINN